MSSKILIVDDDVAMCEMLSDYFQAKGYRTRTATNAADAIASLRDRLPDLMLTDLRIGPDNGLELCSAALEIDPDMPVVVMTGFGDLDAAVGAIRAGAYDFVKKPIELGVLDIVLQRALTNLDLRREVARLRASAPQKAVGGIIGSSPKIQSVLDLITRIADTDTSVLVTGESGTGKELVANALHQASSRSKGPFVAVNCAALPSALLESELFGHKKGAFTDARADRDGLFVQADGGTLFLDEIGEMPMDMQVKLLRALQERKVRPVGGTKESTFDTRIVAATNQDIEQQVEDGTFREDLYYRINVVRVTLPPLRARGPDVLEIGQSFISDIAQRMNKPVVGISESAAEKMLQYDWPGNVRELRNAMERAVALARLEQITPEDLPDRISSYTPERVEVFATHAEDMPTLEVLEARYIRRVLKMVDDNKSRAAEILGVGRSTLYRRLERLDGESGEDDAS